MNDAGGDAAADQPPILEELIGRTLGRYRIERAIGHGSMGVVFEARDEQLDRRVALKVLPPGLGATDKAIRRFLREAQAVAQLDHENIVDIYEVGQEGSTHYYAMQFLEGDPLDAILRRRSTLPAPEAARITCTAARAVHFAHQRGMIHRDIKPSNIIVLEEGDKVVLTDFGLAKQEKGAALTDSGAMVGTPLYMSPEQIRAREVDRRTDVYSLGATLYELVVGRPPFHGTTTQEILQSILDDEPPFARASNSTVPHELSVIAHQCLEKDARRRYPSSLALAQDLERFLEGEPILAKGSSFVGRTWRRLRKHRAVTALSGAIVLSLLVLFASFKLMTDRRQDAAGEALGAARRSFESGLYLSAMDHADEALGYDPDSTEAVLEHARALARAALQIEETLRKSPDEDEARQRLEAMRGDFPDTVARFHRVLGRNPEDPRALLYLGELRLLLGDVGERRVAARDIRYAEQYGENAWIVQWELAELRFSLARDQALAARRAAEMAQDALGFASQAINLLGNAELSPEVTEEERSRHLSDLHILRANVFQLLFEDSPVSRVYLELCRSDARRAAQLDPKKNAERVSLLETWVDSMLGDAGEGTDEVPATATPAPLLVTLTNLLITQESERTQTLNSLVRKGRETVQDGWQATEFLRSGLLDAFLGTDPLAADEPAQGDPGPVVPSTQEGAADLAEVHADEARRILQDLDEGTEDVALLERTVQHLERAVSLDPENPAYHYLLSASHQTLNRLDDALDHAKLASRLAPSDPMYHYQCSILARDLERYREALAEAEAAVAIMPTHALLLLLAGQLHLDCGRRVATDDPLSPGEHLVKAEELLARIQGLVPDGPEATSLQQDLELFRANQTSASPPTASQGGPANAGEGGG